MAEAQRGGEVRLAGKFSLVIPVHNESANMTRVIPVARETLKQVATTYEIVLVDDGSTDDTVAVAQAEMGDQADRLRVVTHARKSGYGITVADGLRAATGDWVAFVDGDGQFDLRDLHRLAELADGADLVAGWRIHRADPWHRSVVSGTFNVLVRLLYGISYRDVDCGFKLMRRGLLQVAEPILSRSALLNTELYFKAQRSRLVVRQVGIGHHPRVAGVRSGGRLVPILRAVRELVRLRIALARSWHPPAASGERGTS
ncbi:MAG TPA: glycosyltransferase family 2 protein [Candidatus Acidoferrales bacterium]|nr:glycosyltransferase family 2 protein [Candidatus Acidoferrales bacterium]